MATRQYIFKTFINPNIKVGDKVRICDGSGLTRELDDDNHYYIINSYSHITKTDKNLKEIIATVVAININDSISITHAGFARLQDIIIQLGDAKFRTCSQFVIQCDEHGNYIDQVRNKLIEDNTYKIEEQE